MTDAGGTGSDEALIQAVYEQHGHAVLAYATTLTGDRAAAEDVLQGTLIRVWRHREVLVNDKGSVRGWLYTVARDIVMDRARAMGTRPREAAESPSRPPTERDHAGQGIDSMAVWGAVQDLPEEQREVIVQVHVLRRSLREASEALGLPEGTITSRLHYAMRALRKLLGADLR